MFDSRQCSEPLTVILELLRGFNILSGFFLLFLCVGFIPSVTDTR